MQKDRLTIKDKVAVVRLESASPPVQLKDIDSGKLEEYRKQLRYIGSKGINVAVGMKQIVDELNLRKSNA